MKARLRLRAPLAGAWLALLLAGCSVEISSPQLAATATIAATIASPPAALPTILQPGNPVALLTPTPRPTTAQGAIATPRSGLPTPLPLPGSAAGAWAALQLRGQALLSNGSHGVFSIDLASGAKTTLFTPPENSHLTAALRAPDGTQMVLCYAPPPADGKVQRGFTGLYLLPAAGGAEPLALVDNAAGQEAYFMPVWSPDGKYLYYSHVVADAAFQNNVERMQFPDGAAEVLVQNAYRPALSADGTQLAYLGVDAESFALGVFIAAADGSAARQLVPPEAFYTLDEIFFAADGSAVYVSTVGDYTPQPLSWLDRLLGVGIAGAHSVPSDWWRADVRTGALQRITDVQGIGLYGSPLGASGRILFRSHQGLFTAQADGGALQHLLALEALGSLQWFP